jgi:citrate synthase
LHGGANEEVLDMLEEIGDRSNLRSWVEEAVVKKKKIMGFGHRVYKVKDPRATVLQELAEHVFSDTGRPAQYEMAVEMDKIMAELLGAKGIYPNVDFYSGIIYSAIGIPRDLFTPIFAIARVTGWLSHWLEQLQNNRIFRPEQVFVGKRDVNYTPLGQRP